ncbi:MAG: RICIN domain-containing protein [Steroidobacteraceae bacterium]|nr:RICIN domain-containing protein [Steroidobacteraceae bacterium]
MWHFHAVPNRPGMFLIRNVATGRVLDARNACVRSNGCEVRQRDARNGDSTQVWILERAN